VRFVKTRYVYLGKGLPLPFDLDEEGMRDHEWWMNERRKALEGPMSIWQGLTNEDKRKVAKEITDEMKREAHEWKEFSHDWRGNYKVTDIANLNAMIDAIREPILDRIDRIVSDVSHINAQLEKMSWDVNIKITCLFGLQLLFALSLLGHVLFH
jgi:hypothetical protein